MIQVCLIVLKIFLLIVVYVGLIVNEYSSDIYIDRLLKSATTLENTIKPNEGDIYVCQSYSEDKLVLDGIINNLTVKTTSTSPEDICVYIKEDLML